MTIITEATCKGGAGRHLDPDFYPHGSRQRIAIKQHLFSRKISIYRLRGHDMEVRGSRVTYEDLGNFMSEWGEFSNVEVDQL